MNRPPKEGEDKPSPLLCYVTCAGSQDKRAHISNLSRARTSHRPYYATCRWRAGQEGVH